MKSTLMGKGADRVLWLDLFKFLMNDADVIDLEHDMTFRFSTSQPECFSLGYIYQQWMATNMHTSCHSTTAIQFDEDLLQKDWRPVLTITGS